MPDNGTSHAFSDPDDYQAGIRDAKVNPVVTGGGNSMRVEMLF
jgi:hypothetical protein